MRSLQRQIHTLLLLLLTALSTAFYLPDDDFLNRLIEQFRKYNLERPVEKVYVHTDREVYAAGETIWLKGYLFGGNTHTADTISKVVYADLIDVASRQVRLRAQLRATASYAPGQFVLPDSLSAGTYQLRVYTNFMRNYPDNYFFTKTLTILRPEGGGATGQGRLNQTVSEAVPRLDVQFLPEGGQLVEGLDARVAFRAVGPNGRGQTVQGYVLNSQKDTVVGFSSSHHGMGTFILKPEAAQTYTAFVRQPDGSVAPYPIPAAQPQGVSMQVDNLTNKENIRVYIRHNKASVNPNAVMTLLAQTRGQVVQAAKIPMAKKMGVVQLARNQFPEGIAQLTLFDETNKPVGERLVYVDRNERINVTISASKPAYRTRDRVDLTITTTNAEGKPAPANLSLAAVDARLSPETDSNQTTIRSHLLLSSDLTGFIEQPDYYFNPTHTDRAAKLDLLLMTQGWRRFVWADVLSGAIPPTNYPIERGLSLTGRVLRSNQKEVDGVVRLNFVLVRRDSTREFLTGETNEQGLFAAYDLDFTDTTTVLIQGVKGKANRDLTINLDQFLTPPVTIVKPPYNPLAFDRDDYAEFLKRTREYMEIERQIRNNREVLLQSVTVKAKKYEAPDTRKIYGVSDATVKFDQNNTAGRVTILDVIQGRVAGVQVSGSGFGARVQIRGAANFGGAIEPLFLIDGTPTDLQGALSISVNDVDQVDVLKGPSAAIYGSRAAGGVISILTKRGSPNYDLTTEKAPGTLVAKLPGYAPVREFYAPRYDEKKPEHVRPDYRTTLFWAPVVQTSAEGKATISFFTSDAKTELRIRAEGATFTGMPGVGLKSLRVE